MSRARILVVDDEMVPRRLLEDLLTREGYEVVTAEDGEAALDRLQESQFDLLITDLQMPKLDGLDLLREVQRAGGHTICMLLTGHATVESAIEAMRIGAFDYLTKPFKSDALRLQVQRALEYGKLQNENQQLRRQVRDKYKFTNLVGDSEAMAEIYRMIGKVADSGATVLIQGVSLSCAMRSGRTQMRIA